MCTVTDCRTLRWPHAHVCPGCGYDYHAWRRNAYKAAVLILLVLILFALI